MGMVHSSPEIRSILLHSWCFSRNYKHSKPCPIITNRIARGALPSISNHTRIYRIGSKDTIIRGLHHGHLPLSKLSHFEDSTFHQKDSSSRQFVLIELASDCFRGRVGIPELHVQGGYYIRRGDSAHLGYYFTLQDDFRARIVLSEGESARGRQPLQDQRLPQKMMYIPLQTDDLYSTSNEQLLIKDLSLGKVH